MNQGVIVTSVILLAALGFLFGGGLAYASRVFAVLRDERVDKLLEILPGANCGACGFAGCSGFAEALVAGNAAITGCPVTRGEARESLASILGQEPASAEERVAVINCRGDKGSITNLFEYHGLQDCRAAARLYNGAKECAYGCLGMGSCVSACPFGAIRMMDNGLPEVEARKCTGCGLCVAACPRGVISLAPSGAPTHVLCASPEPGKAVRHICRVGCIKCRKCSKVCPVGAFDFESGCARINYDLCTGCGECVPACPTHSIYLKPDNRITDPSTDI